MSPSPSPATQPILTDPHRPAATHFRAPPPRYLPIVPQNFPGHFLASGSTLFLKTLAGPHIYGSAAGSGPQEKDHTTMKLTATQLRKIIAEEVQRAAGSQRLLEVGLGGLADDAEITKVKGALAGFVEHLRAAAEVEYGGDPQEVQDAVHHALDELMEEVFLAAGFEEMSFGYYRG